MSNRNNLGLFITIMAAFIFGFYPSATRGAYADGANITFIILLTTFYRMVALNAFCFFAKRKLFETRKKIIDGAENGFFQTASIVGILGAMAYLPGSVVITIMFSHTILLYFFLIFKKREKFSYTLSFIILIALLGLSLTTGIIEENFVFSGIGFALAFMAALATSTRIYRYENQMKDSDPALVGAETFIFTMLFCILIAFYQFPVLPQTLTGWMWSHISGISLALGSFGIFYGISMIGAIRFGVYAKLEPVFGAILAYFLIGEILQPFQYVGIALVILSLIAFQLIRNNRGIKKSA